MCSFIRSSTQIYFSADPARVFKKKFRPENALRLDSGTKRRLARAPKPDDSLATCCCRKDGARNELLQQ
ncbi:MAG: hypothetical protein CMJ95_02510 [Planctomycetes bacterium]|nr:hypothetical protein [Planctomycetota bacterium]